MYNPVSELLVWFQKQPDEVQDEIIGLMAAQHPNFANMEHADNQTELRKIFCDRLASFTGDQLGNVGFIISFRAIFDYFLVAKRGDEDAWHNSERVMQFVIQNADKSQPEHMISSAREWLAEMPGRKNQWISVCNSWQILKHSFLSDACIEEWDDSSYLARSQSNGA